MSKKRTSPEFSTDLQTNSEGSVAVFKEDDGVKRVKLTSVSNTTLQDLPLELIERIFVRAIVMEVEEMHLAKSVWKEKAQLVISQLSSVCPDWRDILTTNFFQNELYRTLDRTDEKPILLEILRQSPIEMCEGPYVTSLKDEMFVLVDDFECSINVYDLNNMAVLKGVIDLKDMEARGMVACSVSNCLYVLNVKRSDQVVVYRIEKEAVIQFTISPFISATWKPGNLSVADNGNLVLWKNVKREQSAKVCVYDANGSLHQDISLSSDLRGLHEVLMRSNGNLILVSFLTHKVAADDDDDDAEDDEEVDNCEDDYDEEDDAEDDGLNEDENDDDEYDEEVDNGEDDEEDDDEDDDEDNAEDEGYYRMSLVEIDTCGTVLHRYRSPHWGMGQVCLVNPYGRILILKELNKFELLDSEFNLLSVISPQLDMDKLVDDFYTFETLQYKNDRNELITIFTDLESTYLYTFRFK